MIVVVAEKPSVGRDLARVLRCREKGDGFLKGETHIVTWAVGHLITLVEPQEISEAYRKWRMEDLPILPETIATKVIFKTRSQFKVISSLINAGETERIVCATDAGREGELIFRLIYEKAGCTKPVDRLWISSMTDSAIKEGFDSLKPSRDYDGLYESAACRSKADWLVGMNASRAFTIRYHALLSVGRVQTPTLNILVKRRKEIEGFVPKTYYTVEADFGDYQGKWFRKDAQGAEAFRIPDKDRADEIVGRVKRKEALVESVLTEEKKEWPPFLYDLTLLQQEANRALGFKASKTLEIAQALYEKHKCITYPRTDSRHLPLDMAGRVYKALKALPEAYQGLVARIPEEKGRFPIWKRMYDNEKISDHHAIIPTDRRVDPTRLSRDEAALYDMVARRLIAGHFPPYVYDSTRVVTGCEEESFQSIGKVVKEEGWKQVIPGKKDEDAALPALQEGEKRRVQGAKARKEATRPPAPHTDASLLSAMEHAGREIEDEELREQIKKSGIGTPATRAAILERLIQVGYAERRGKTLSATDKGVRLIEVVPEAVASPEMTGRWEKALSDIADNAGDTGRFMQGIRRLSAHLVQYARDEAPDVQFEQEAWKGKKARKAQKPLPDAVCPLCGSPVTETEKAFGCSAWKKGCAFTLWKNALIRAGGPMLNAAIVKKLLKDGRVQGSTGWIRLLDGQMQFVKKGEENPCVSVSVAYRKQAACGQGKGPAQD